VERTEIVERTEVADDLRDALLDAAARVVARQGYDGTKLQDIVREAGLSTGAVYGRFRSKGELLREALMTRSIPSSRSVPPEHTKVADLVTSLAMRTDGALSDGEALLLETFVTARRQPEVSSALAAAGRQWHRAVSPLVEEAKQDGTIEPSVDPGAVLFLVRVLRLGLLVHRGSGLPSPDPEGWHALMQRIVASFGDSHPEDHLSEAAPRAEAVPGAGAASDTEAATTIAGPGATHDRDEPVGYHSGSR
jgi:AcrR family transcriptional regulator